MQVWRDSSTLTSGHGATQAQVDTGAGAPGITFARDEAAATTIPIPTATGTHFSWPMWVYLYVSALGSGTTHITNRVASVASGMPTGSHEWGKYVASGSYVQPTTNADSDNGSNGATPSGYTEITTGGFQWDNASVQGGGGSTGQNGGYLEVSIGVDHLYTGGGGVPTLPNLDCAFDEGPAIIPFAPFMFALHHDLRVGAVAAALGMALYGFRLWRRRHGHVARKMGISRLFSI